MSNTEVTRKLVSPFYLFAQSWRAFEMLFKKLALIYIFSFLPIVVSVLIETVDKNRSIATNIVLLILFTLSSLLVIVGQMAIIFAVKFRTENFSAWQYFKMGLRKTHSGFWVYFLLFGIIFLWALLIGYFIFTPYFLAHLYSSYDVGFSRLKVLSLFLLALLILCVIFVAIQLVIEYFFSLFFLVDKDFRGTAALAQSRSNTSGLKFGLAVRLLVLFVVYLAISVIFSFIFNYLLPASIIVSFILGLFQGILSAYATLYCYFLYENLVAIGPDPTVTMPISKGRKVGMLISAFLGLFLTLTSVLALPEILYFFLYTEVSNSGTTPTVQVPFSNTSTDNPATIIVPSK